MMKLLERGNDNTFKETTADAGTLSIDEMGAVIRWRSSTQTSSLPVGQIYGNSFAKANVPNRKMQKSHGVNLTYCRTQCKTLLIVTNKLSASLAIEMSTSEGKRFSAHLFQRGDNLHQDFTNSLDVGTDAKDALNFIHQGQATHTHTQGGEGGCQHGNRGGREQYFRFRKSPSRFIC